MLNIGKEGTYRFLNESTYVIIVMKCGNPPQLSQFSENCFQFQCDAPYYAEGTQNPGQKPIAFYERIRIIYNERRLDIRWTKWNR